MPLTNAYFFHKAGKIFAGKIMFVHSSTVTEDLYMIFPGITDGSQKPGGKT